MHEYRDMYDLLETMSAKEDLPEETKALVKVFKKYVRNVEDRLKSLEKLTEEAKRRSMIR